MASFRIAAGALALIALVPLGACKQDASKETAKSDAKAAPAGTLASSLASAPHLSTVSSAFSDAGLATVFDGPGSYTLLAPEDDAFGKLDLKSGDLKSPELRPVLVAMLRDHILPGAITPDAIRQAIKAKGGPVKMRTLGDGVVTFSASGDDIMVEGENGKTAKLDGQAATASNGVVLPIDGLLKTPQPVAPAKA